MATKKSGSQALEDQIANDPMVTGPQEPQNDEEVKTTEVEVPDVNEATTEGTDIPVTDADDTSTPPEDPVAPADVPLVSANDTIGQDPAGTAGTFQDTTAVKEPWHRDLNKSPAVAESTNQTEEVLNANNPDSDPNRPVVGHVIKQFSDRQLEDELFDLAPSAVDEWVAKHFDARTASIDTLSRVTRYRRTEIIAILKEAGYKFPEGM